jgi:exodeoxyribonuclease V beta subunit
VTPVRVLRPPQLARLGARHAVVEASAGTGKTFILEHLVVELLLRRDAELEQILVVTFTEKATAELVQRVRAKLTELRDAGPDHPLARAAAGAADEDCWLLDERARQRLRRALLAFDRASITTIHGFCQRLLGEHAFLHQRLFDEELVDEATSFHAAFLDTVRREGAGDPEVAPWLAAWLETSSLERLETRVLLPTHRQARGDTALRPGPLDEAALVAALDEVATIEVDEGALLAALKRLGVNHQSARAVAGRLGTLSAIARRFQAGRGVVRAVAELEAAEGRGGELLPYICARITAVPEDRSPLGRLAGLVRRLDQLAVPLSSELVHRLLPRVATRLEARKRAAGLYDFQDMLGLVARSLAEEGPRQRALLSTLRARYRFALIDEFQDTDDVQWSIFRRIFLEGGGGQVITVIGDPKQAIYSFRGADVQTYLRARTELLAGGEPLHLEANFRSTEPLIAAYNAILDQSASPEPFFRAAGRIHYDHPVRCGRPEVALVDAHGAEAAPVVVLDVRSQSGGLLTWQVKQALQARVVEELRALLSEEGRLSLRGPRGEERAVGASDIYVLTRTTRESREVGAALRAAQIPFAFFKQEKLFETIEAREVLDLLRAIADPDDRTARARAWITAFFGLSLPDLAACEELPPGHPLLRLLYQWKGLGDAGDLETMLARIVEESGIVCREVFLRETERSLTNYLHVLEVLQEEVARSRSTVRELTQTLAAYVAGLRTPPGQQRDIQRLETDREAVQIMTIHHAKGLEADVVFLYGGLWTGPSNEVHLFHDEAGRRALRIGRVPVEEAALVKDRDADEERRVLYVGLTRARGRLYLPQYPPSFDSKLPGCYRFINNRLRELLGPFPDPRSALFSVVPVACPAPAPLAARPPPAPALAAWTPPPALLSPDAPEDELRALVEGRAGFAVTSYSAVKRRRGGFAAADATGADDPAAEERGAPVVEAALPAGELPRGRLSGSFLHELLEEVELDGLRARPPLEEWRARPEVEALFERLRRRHDRHPGHLPHAQRLVHTALTAPVRLGAHTIRGLASAAQLAREMEFLYPIPERGQPLLGVEGSEGRPWRIERGVVKGFVDLLFAHEGRAYVCDWKGDWLPSWEAEPLAAHAERHYGVQARLYTLAALRFLGIDSEVRHRDHFGGVLYCFLRGMRPDDPAAGVYFRRPSWEEIVGWQREMLGSEFWGLA